MSKTRHLLLSCDVLITMQQCIVGHRYLFRFTFILTCSMHCTVLKKPFYICMFGCYISTIFYLNSKVLAGALYSGIGRKDFLYSIRFQMKFLKYILLCFSYKKVIKDQQFWVNLKNP